MPSDLPSPLEPSHLTAVTVTSITRGGWNPHLKDTVFLKPLLLLVDQGQGMVTSHSLASCPVVTEYRMGTQIWVELHRAPLTFFSPSALSDHCFHELSRFLHPAPTPSCPVALHRPGYPQQTDWPTQPGGSHQNQESVCEPSLPASCLFLREKQRIGHREGTERPGRQFP